MHLYNENSHNVWITNETIAKFPIWSIQRFKGTPLEEIYYNFNIDGNLPLAASVFEIPSFCLSETEMSPILNSGREMIRV